MENGNILDEQITASSYWSITHRASNGRLNFTPRDERTGAWSSGNSSFPQWLQVDFKRSTVITGISTQGRNYGNNTVANQFVKRYTISASKDGKIFRSYKQEETVKEFQGNSDRNTIVHNIFSPPISARFIRVHPTDWNAHISMRVEFYGCN
ncbi:coagulation factor VIII-like [Dendronephthya gigantea]|uniref:coagulation factor VIII-like n=1 Tax=Dendronephthya gigantea TaxID=151771 RepID=UPI00106C4828|nr:coagulation factor VIII-like [Dendronephthya gigantea]